MFIVCLVQSVKMNNWVAKLRTINWMAKKLVFISFVDWHFCRTSKFVCSIVCFAYWFGCSSTMVFVLFICLMDLTELFDNSAWTICHCCIVKKSWQSWVVFACHWWFVLSSNMHLKMNQNRLTESSVKSLKTYQQTRYNKIKHNQSKI
jgi:hypothetical protein